jgi:hypothetical protein
MQVLWLLLSELIMLFGRTVGYLTLLLLGG